MTAGPGKPPTAEERWLFGAIPERHTNRGPFHERAIGSGLIHRVIDAASAEGAVLTVLDASAARRVLEIADEAAVEITRDGRRHDELSSWVHSKPEPDGKGIKTADSQFGDVLFDESDRAIYIFDLEKTSESECYGDCAIEWPPVLTKGDPVAQGDVKQSKLPPRRSPEENRRRAARDRGPRDLRHQTSERACSSP